MDPWRFVLPMRSSLRSPPELLPSLPELRYRWDVNRKKREGDRRGERWRGDKAAVA